MRKRKLANFLITALVANVGVLAAGSLSDGAVAGQCPNNNWSNKMNATDDFFNNDGVNIRTGNDISCTSKGHGQRFHSVTLHCSRSGGGWIHLRDNTTGISGWVFFTQLTLEGGDIPC